MEKEKIKDKEEKPEILPAEVRAVMLSKESSIFFNVALFEQAQRVAKLFSDSTMVPTQFRGNLGNCMIALNYAARIQADPFMVFQCLYEVHGRPGIEGKLVEAIINASNKYSEPLQYEWLDPEDKLVERHTVLKHKDFKAFGCQAFSIDAKSQKRVDGPKITWELVKAEGWYDKQGSKWQTMPEMMFYYRAASWFGNKNCPELKLGMHTVEELEDVVELSPRRNGSYAMTDAAAALNDKIKADKKGEPKTDIYKTKESPTTKKPEGEEEQEDQIRKLYINLRKPGLKEFVASHLDAIPGMEEKYQAEIRSKWAGFYPDEEYPLDVPKEEATQNSVNMYGEGMQDQPPPDEKEPVKPDPPIMLNCPLSHEDRKEQNDEGRVNVDVCDNVCEGKDKCVAYMKYQANIEG